MMSAKRRTPGNGSRRLQLDRDDYKRLGFNLALQVAAVVLLILGQSAIDAYGEQVKDWDLVWGGGIVGAANTIVFMLYRFLRDNQRDS